MPHHPATESRTIRAEPSSPSLGQPLRMFDGQSALQCSPKSPQGAQTEPQGAPKDTRACRDLQLQDKGRSRQCGVIRKTPHFHVRMQKFPTRVLVIAMSVLPDLLHGKLFFSSCRCGWADGSQTRCAGALSHVTMRSTGFPIPASIQSCDREFASHTDSSGRSMSVFHAGQWGASMLSFLFSCSDIDSPLAPLDGWVGTMTLFFCCSPIAFLACFPWKLFPSQLGGCKLDKLPQHGPRAVLDKMS